MRSNLYVTVKVPAGQIEIDREGLRYVPEEAGDTAWVLSLTEAERVFNAVTRSVQVLLEVEPGRESSDWRTTSGPDPDPPSPAPSTDLCVDGRGHLEAGSLAEVDESDSLGTRLWPPRVLAPSVSAQPYCPFCQAPTCKCWEDHVCR